MISSGKEMALREILLNYANDESSVTSITIKAILSILDCDGEKTLRDEFAMAALAGIMAYQGTYQGDITDLPGTLAYKIADQMLEARK